MIQAGTNPYQSQAVETAGPAQLVLMLYDRILTGILRAQTAEGPEARATVNHELQRVQTILMELTVTLDHERGGAIAGNLAALYDFCRDRVIRANISQDLSLLDGVWPVVSELREAWEQGCVLARPEAVASSR